MIRIIPKICAFALLVTWAIYANQNTYIAASALLGAAFIVFLTEKKYPQ